jgi:hypothetical protein
MPILYGADASPLMEDPDLDGREQHDEHRLERSRPLHAPQTNRCGTNDSAWDVEVTW